MKDCNGVDLTVGDTVLWRADHGEFRSELTGKVVAFSERFVRVETSNYEYGRILQKYPHNVKLMLSPDLVMDEGL